MYDAPPTTATTARQVRAAASERLTFMPTSRRCIGPSRAAPSTASSTGVTTVRKTVHSQTTRARTAVTSRTTAHQAARRLTGSGSREFDTPSSNHFG